MNKHRQRVAEKQPNKHRTSKKLCTVKTPHLRAPNTTVTKKDASLFHFPT